MFDNHEFMSFDLCYVCMLGDGGGFGSCIFFLCRTILDFEFLKSVINSIVRKIQGPNIF